MYSTLALEKEREIVKEETALRKEKEAVCCYAVQSYIYTGSRDGLENHMHTYIIYIYVHVHCIYMYVHCYLHVQCTSFVHLAHNVYCVS